MRRVRGTIKVLGVEDQKVSFDLFEAMKHPNDKKAFFDPDKVEQEIELAAIARVLHSPLEKALINHVECLTKEEEHEVQTCIKELDGAGENSEGHTVFEELKNGGKIEKTKSRIEDLACTFEVCILGRQ